MDYINMAWERFSSNLQASFELMTVKKWIRVVMVVGTYLLVRPYMIKLGKKSQMSSHEAAETPLADGTTLSPNELRGHIDIPEDSEDDDDAQAAVRAQATGPSWGKQARRRQRKFLKDMIDAQEAKLQETRDEEEDKDIEEFLVKG